MSAIIRVALSRKELEIEPGQRREVSVTVQNLSEIIDRYRIAVEGIDPSWVTISPEELALFPTDQDQARIILHPPATPEARAGRYPVQVQATSEENPGERTTVALNLEVVAVPALDVTLRPQKQSGMGEGTFRVELSNRGNADITVQLEATDPEEGCHYSFDPPEVAVPASEERTVPLTVRPKAPLPAEESRTFPFTVTARPAEVPRLTRKVRGEWVQVPPVLDVALISQKERGVAGASFAVQVSNLGDAELTVRLEAMGPEETVEYMFDVPEVVVPAEEERLVQLKVRSTARLRGAATKTHPFAVTARPIEAPYLTCRVQGEWVQVPLAFDLALQPQKQTGAARGTFTVQVRNPGDADLSVELEAMGAEEGGEYTVDSPQVVVPADEERQVQLVVRPEAPLTGRQSRTFSFTVIGRVAEAPQVIRHVQGEWVQVPRAFDLTLSPEKQSGADEGAFRVQITNPGDADVTVQFEGMDPEGSCTYIFEPSRVAVPAGQERVVGLRVRSKAPLSGKEPRTYPFTVVARSAEDPGLTRQVAGEWEQLPTTDLLQGFWLQWVLMNGVGSVVGAIVAPAIWGPDPGAVGVFVGLAVVGASVGTLQWLVLRRMVGVGRGWILASAAGAVFLVSIGVTQWFLLRRHVRRAGWWIVANLVGWPSGLIAGFIVALALFGDSEYAAYVVILTGGGLAAGAATGWTLIRLLRQHAPEA